MSRASTSGDGHADRARADAAGRWSAATPGCWRTGAWRCAAIGTGIGILASQDPVPWVWGRVGGDALDMATVAAGIGGRGTGRAVLALLTLAGAPADEPEVERSITIGKTADELYQRWREPNTLPQVMAFLATVRASGDSRMHWRREGPLGRSLEWDMADGNLNGLKVAILITDVFEQVEMTEPRKALDQAGAETSIVSPKEKQVRAWRFTEWGDEFPVDITLDSARPEDCDAILLPGGIMNPDTLRTIENAILFAQTFLDAGKPVASICHGPWTLIETGKMRGRRLAAWPSFQTDLENAGAEWVDQEAVVDDNLVTSRKPDDIPAFNREMIALFGRMRGRQAQNVA